RCIPSGGVVPPSQTPGMLGRRALPDGRLAALGAAPPFVRWVLVSSTSGQDWEKADRETKRLPPSSFAGLPMAIRRDLERRGCTIPQPFTARRPSNVISGRFTSPSRTDWAVLCSISQVSSILVFRGGSALAAEEFARHSDSTFLQVVGSGDTVGYSRTIVTANAEYIRAHARGDVRMPRVTHEGINDLFIEKGSSVWYWSGGRWLELPGAD